MAPRAAHKAARGGGISRTARRGGLRRGLGEWGRRGGKGDDGLLGLAFNSDTQWARLADAFTAGSQQMWWRGALLARPQNGRTGYLFGNSGFGGPGFCFASEGYPGDAGAPTGRGYTWADSNYRIPPSGFPSLVFPLEAIGKPFTVHAWRDGGGKMHVAIDGKEYGVPVAIAQPNLGSTIGWGINTRASLDGANPFGRFVTFECGMATSVPNLTDVRAHATAKPGTTMPSTIEFFDGRFLGTNAGKWTGRILSKQLNLNGSPAQMRVRGSWGLGLGSVVFHGDSHMLGRTGATGLVSSPGMRRPFFQACWAAGVSVSLFGATLNGSNVEDPRDYDGRHSGVGGKGLGVPSAGNSMIADVASDAATWIDPSGTRVFQALSNDLAYRINTLLETPATAAANCLSDVGTYIGGLRSNGFSGRIIWCSPPRPSTAVSNANQRAAHDLVYASLATTVDNARIAHGGDVRFYDWASKWTPDYSGAGLDDGTHHTPARYAQIGPDFAGFMMGLAR